MFHVFRWHPFIWIFDECGELFFVFMQTQSLWTAKQQEAADPKGPSGLQGENVCNSCVDAYTTAEGASGRDSLRLARSRRRVLYAASMRE